MNSQEFAYLCDLVRERSAIVIEAGKEYLVEARLDPVAKAEGMNDISELVRRLKAGGSGLEEKVVEAMTTNETSFFRDQTPFDTLRDHVLPELMKERVSSKRLRIWCAASSTGQEPYSIAMLLRGQVSELASWNTSILASDLSNNVLDRARAGIYSQLEVNRGMPATSLVDFFRQDGRCWALKDEIRSMVEFKQINLIGAWPIIPEQDIVFIRNVLIYFDVATKRQILERIRGVMSPDGYLFLGGSETTLNIDDALERVEYENGSCYRLRDR